MLQKLNKKYQGTSLIEVLVVIVIFSVLAILATRGLFLALQGSRKSASQVAVRENIDTAISVIERQLRNAEGLVTTCPNLTPLVLDYIDQESNPTSFSCVDIGTDGHIASASARITNNDVNVTACSFTCELGVGSNPPSVTLAVEASGSHGVGKDVGSITASTKVFLRTY